ncbi:ATP-binding cassette sub-family B member 10, mitochondrial [Nymphon striatum]|nr:ATP-binding cassette sub-family B member 10, mitochondrial [Nymphon striatum]
MYFSKFTFCLFRQSSTYTSVLKCYENVHFYSTLRNKSVFDFAKDIKYINKRNSRRLFSKYANKVNGKQDKVKRKLPNKDELFRFIRLAKPERLRIAGAIGFLVITSGVTLAVPYCLGKVIDIIYSTPKNEMKEKLQNFCLVLMVVFIVGGLANFGRVYLMETAGQRIIQNIRKGVYSSILKQETAFFDKNKSGELVNRLSSDTTVVGFSVTMNISDGLRSLFGAIAGVSMMFYTSVQLAFVGMGTFPPVALLMVFYGRYMIQIAKNIQNSLAASTQVASEHISNIRTVRAFSQEDKEIKKYNNHINNVLSLIYKECLVKGVFFGLTGMSGNFIILAVLYQGGMMMTEAQLSVGQLTSFLMYAAYVAMSVGGMSSFYSELIKGVGASSRLFELLDRKSLIPIKGGVFPSAHMLGSISFENVAFRYPSRPESIIFENLNLNVQPGSILAVVGGSGSGKSTIGGLLLRFYDPNA